VVAFFVAMKYKKIILLLWILSCFNIVSVAQKNYHFTATCIQAYNDILQLKLHNGQQLLDKAKEENADNLIPYFLENYIDFLKLFFDENPVEYAQLKEAMEQRLALLEKGNKQSAFYHYCLSQMQFHKTTVALKFGEKWTGAWAFKRAFQHIKTGIKQHPDFGPNQLLYGSLQTIIGTLPKGYSFLAGLFGMKGTIPEGMQRVRSFSNANDVWANIFKTEAIFIKSYLQFYIENKKEETLQQIQQQKLDVVNNHLFAYMAANLGLNYQMTDYARTVMSKRNQSAAYHRLVVWDYYEGIAAMQQLQLVEAAQNLEQFLQHFKGNFYVKDAYLKLSWCYYLAGNKANAEKNKKLTLQKGNTYSDADAQAQKEAKLGYWPNAALLKARILCDGGYFNEALKTATALKSEMLDKEEEKLELTYRLGRIYDELKKKQQALQYYIATIESPNTTKTYFPARAALQAGYIYEQQGNKEEAIKYFNICLAMEGHAYKNSLDQKAKTAILRCKGE